MIANLFQRVRFIEKMGTGISRMKQEVLKAGLQEPQYEFTGFFTILFKRQNAPKVEEINNRLGDKLGDTELKILELILRIKTFL